MKTLKIGQLARATGVRIDTIRYYERERLLAAPERRTSGYRQYDDAAVARLAFIRDAKELGFTLAEIRELLRLWFDSSSRCEHVRELATRKVAEIESKLASLQAMRRTLKKVLRECAAQQSKADCPLLHGLNGSSAVPRSRTRRAKPGG